MIQKKKSLTKKPKVIKYFVHHENDSLYPEEVFI